MARKKRRRSYHSGSYQYRGGRHITQYYEAGKRRTKSFSSEAEALAYLAGLDSRASGPPRTRTEQTLGVLVTSWLDSRSSMASNYDDVSRWRAHWQDLVGHLKPAEVTVGVLKESIAKMQAGGLGGATVSLCLKLLSSLYGDLVEEGAAEVNPVSLLSKKTRAALRSTHDSKNTPYVKSEQDVGRIYRQLLSRSQDVALAYAIGALAGLRTSEVRALVWDRDVDLANRTITVRRQVARRGEGTKPTKDRDGRVVPISNSLYGILRAHSRFDVGMDGLVVHCDGKFLSDELMRSELRIALDKLGLNASCACCNSPMGFYEATRHGFASRWVFRGGNIHTLSRMLGHSSVTTTERYYVHLAPGSFSDDDRGHLSPLGF